MILARPLDFEPTVQYDYLPVGSDAVDLFVLTDVAGSMRDMDGSGGLRGVALDYPAKDPLPRWSFRCFRYRGKWSDKDGAWAPGTWTKRADFSVAFRESFRVFARDADYFFVTESGKLFVAKGAVRGERKVEPLWSDDTRPITAVVSQEESGKTFAFGRYLEDGPDRGKGFYFELEEKLRPVSVAPATLPPVDRAAALDTVVKYTRLLMNATRIQIK